MVTRLKKYYKRMIIITILTVFSILVILNQFQSEDAESNKYTIYEMNNGWQCLSATLGMKQPGESKEIVSLPYVGESEPDEMIVFQNTIPHEYAGLTMTFYSTESTVRVTLNDDVIYQYGIENKRIFGKSPGNRMNFVELPEHIGDGRLRIELISSYENAAATLGRVTVSQKDLIILQLIESNLLNFFCCLVMLICVVIFLSLGFVCIRTNQNTYGVFWLAALGLDVGLYYLIKTELLSIFYGAKAIYSMGQYLFIMLVPIFLLLYLGRNLKKAYPKLFMVLFTVINLNVFVQLVLQIVNIIDLADMADYTEMLFALVIVVGIILNIKEAVTFKKNVYWIIVSVSVVLIIGELTTRIKTATNVHGSIKYSQYAMTLFLFILAGYHIIRVTQDYKEEAEENARKALAANEAKGKFLANMSHEIRTPINAVLGMDEMILREAKEPKIREYAMDIFNAGQSLLYIINDILDLSKIDSGKMEIIPVNYDVSSMIHDLSNMIEQRAKKKDLQFHVEVEPEIPCTLYGDDVRVRQVLTNILTNAVKYTKEGDIWFRICLNKKESQKATLYFEIEDTGIGIKEEDLPKLYTEFERIEESRNRNIEGTGLGMSITLQLLKMMGSSLLVESIYGKGSKFSFYLEQDIVEDKPIGNFEKNVQQLAAEYTYAAGFSAPDAEVLVVDDNAVNRKVFGNLLNQTQVKITEAESGAKCLELTKQKKFDIIFLDHMMPEMDGIETLARIKKDSGNLCGNIPVIALTANAISGAREKYLQAGFSDYLSKPIVSSKLEKMLLDYLPGELIKEADKNAQTAGAEADSMDLGQPDLDNLPMVDGLDWNYAWLHLSEMELLQTTVEDFYKQIPTAAKKLAAYYQDICTKGVFENYRIQVHAMKSLSATIGILPLSGMAKILEDAAKDEKSEIIQKLHTVFMAEWNSYREKLDGVFGIVNADEKEEAEDISIICALLEMLRTAMQEMDFDEADEKMKAIYTYRYKDDVQKNIELLNEYVENLDVEQAENCIQTIIGQLS
ncbi:MAG: response regulator [Butyrivibrio sp.]|nr:response regulator [Butyrivibrio sp.]